MPVVEMVDVSLRRGRQQVLENWDLSIDSGEVVVLSGENGCGKSSVIEACSGLLPLESGSTTISKQLIRDSEGRRGRVAFGLCLQEDCLMGDEIVEERLLDVAECSFDTTSLLKKWKLDHRSKDRVAMLSGGQRRKLAVISGVLPALLSSKPMAVLLDEPDSGLDDESVKMLATLLTDLAAGGHSILVASHNQEIHSIANRVVNFPFSIEKLNPPIGKFEPITGGKQIQRMVGHRINLRTMSLFANNGIAGLLVLGGMLALLEPSTLDAKMRAGFILAPALALGLCGDPLFRLLQENRAHAWWNASKGMTPNSLLHILISAGLLTLLASAAINYYDWKLIAAGALFGFLTATIISWISHATLRLARPNALMLRLLTPIIILPWALIVDTLAV